MTEAALISPLFFALLFGVIEMGILFRDHLTITNATRDGARTAAASGSDVDADWRILQENLPHQKTDARTATWALPVAAKGEAKLTYRVRVMF